MFLSLSSLAPLTPICIRKEFSCLNLICLWSKGVSSSCWIQWRVFFLSSMVMFLMSVSWDIFHLLLKNWALVLGQLCSLVCIVRDGHWSNTLINSRVFFAFFTLLFLLLTVILPCGLLPLCTLQGLRLHHSKLYRGEGEFVQSWGRQVKKKLEKEVRLLFCSYWKNKV